jgi:hypothetical protein
MRVPAMLPTFPGAEVSDPREHAMQTSTAASTINR